MEKVDFRQHTFNYKSSVNPFCRVSVIASSAQKIYFCLPLISLFAVLIWFFCSCENAQDLRGSQFVSHQQWLQKARQREHPTGFCLGPQTLSNSPRLHKTRALLLWSLTAAMHSCVVVLNPRIQNNPYRTLIIISSHGPVASVVLKKPFQTMWKQGLCGLENMKHDRGFALHYGNISLYMSLALMCHCSHDK